MRRTDKVKYSVNRIKIAPSYETKWLEITRPQPLSDNAIENAQIDIIKGKIDNDISDNV